MQTITLHCGSYTDTAPAEYLCPCFQRSKRVTLQLIQDSRVFAIDAASRFALRHSTRVKYIIDPAKYLFQGTADVTQAC